MVTGVVRKKTPSDNAIGVSNIVGFNDLSKVLNGAEVVVHLAGRAHIVHDPVLDPLEEFRLVNTHATISLAQQAAAAGVKRFIFVSSIGVNGCVTRGKPFSVEDIPNPHSPYTQSKYEAELGLKDISDRTGIEVVIIRPPMVYGPNAPGNFGRMVSWLASGVPLPLGAVTGNRRSFVGLDNLVDLISVCIDHPSARNQIFLVSDGEDMSTTDLICRVSRALGKKPNLLPIPPLFLRFVAAAIGKENIAQRLLDNLQIDSLHTCSKLGWAPPVSVDAGISRSVIGFNRN